VRRTARSHVLEGEGARVDPAGLAGQSDVDDAAGRFHEVEGQRRQVGGVRGVDDRVEGQVRECVLPPDVVEAQSAGEGEGVVRPAHEVYVGSGGAGEHGDQQSDGPRA
jgi:hypothetical protein